MPDAPDLRRVLRQNLQMESLLGMSEVPLSRADLAILRQSSTPGVASVATKPQRSPVRSSPKPIAPRRPTAANEGPYAAPEGCAAEEQADRLRVIDAEQVIPCTSCGLAATRNHTVFGQGNPDARLVFVGEAPGFDEDRTGLAFVGKAGQLLTQMIQAMGTSRDDVFICNILKCRPPGNRDPAPDEVFACSPYLFKQLEIIRPEVIVALGAPAARTLLRSNDSIGRLRGRFHDFRLSGPLEAGEPIKLMPTYHPAYLLREPRAKSKTWADLQEVMKLLGFVQPGS